MDELDDILSNNAKKTLTFKKKKILAKDKRTKLLDEAALDDIEMQQTSSQLLKGNISGFRSLKKPKTFKEVKSISPQALTDNLEPKLGPSTDSIAPLTTASSSMIIHDLYIDNAIDVDIQMGASAHVDKIAPPVDVYDLDLPMSSDEVDGVDVMGKAETFHLKSVADQIEFLQDHIFVLQDVGAENEQKIKSLTEKLNQVRLRRENATRSII